MSAIKFWGAVVALLSGPTTTIVLLVVGLPGTLGDAMTWLFDWLPSTGTFIAEHAGYLTPAWALSLFGAALLGWLHLPEIRRNRLAQRTGFTRELAFPTGLYVGTMNVDASHLETEFYLEIAILGFNGTGGAISILIIRFSHPAMMMRYGCGAVRAQAKARRSVRVSSW